MEYVQKQELSQVKWLCQNCGVPLHPRISHPKTILELPVYVLEKFHSPVHSNLEENGILVLCWRISMECTEGLWPGSAASNEVVGGRMC
jgi:hypothetical protein